MSRPPVRASNSTGRSFLSFGKDSPVSSTATSPGDRASLASDPFRSYPSMNASPPLIPARTASVLKSQAIASDPSTLQKSKKSGHKTEIHSAPQIDAQKVKAVNLLTNMVSLVESCFPHSPLIADVQPSKSPKAIEVFTGLKVAPSSTLPLSSVRQPKQSSTSSKGFRRSLALSTSTVLSDTPTTNSGRAADLEEEEDDTAQTQLTYTAPSSPSDSEFRIEGSAPGTQKQTPLELASNSPKVPTKSSMRSRGPSSNTSHHARLRKASESSAGTVNGRIPPLPSVPSSPIRVLPPPVSSRDIPSAKSTRSKPALDSVTASSGGVNTLACLYLVSGLPKECVARIFALESFFTCATVPPIGLPRQKTMS